MWSVCEVVLVPYIVVVVTVMRVMLFLLDVSMVMRGTGEVWVRGMRMWVVHMVQVLCLA